MFDRLLSALTDRLTGPLRQPREGLDRARDERIESPVQPQTLADLFVASHYWVIEWDPGGPKRWNSIAPTLAALWRAVLILAEEAERRRKDQRSDPA